MRGVLSGKDDVIDLLLVGLLGAGHVLVEDVPGVGKTTLAKALSRAPRHDVHASAVHPGPPADGHPRVANPESSRRLAVVPSGPGVHERPPRGRDQPRVTAHAIGAPRGDERVAGDGRRRDTRPARPLLRRRDAEPHRLPGHLPAPEAQLDRFLLRIGVGYPSSEAELAMLYARRTVDPLEAVEPVCDRDGDLSASRREVREVEVKEPVAKYLLRDRPQEPPGRADRAWHQPARRTRVLPRGAGPRAPPRSRVREPGGRPGARRARARASRPAHHRGSLWRRVRGGGRREGRS